MELEFSNIMPTLLNWMVVGLMAVTFIGFWKYFFSIYTPPGMRGIADFFTGI